MYYVCYKTNKNKTSAMFTFMLLLALDMRHVTLCCDFINLRNFVALKELQIMPFSVVTCLDQDYSIL